MHSFARNIGLALLVLLLGANAHYDYQKFMADKTQVERFIQEQDSLSLYTYIGKAHTVEMMASGSFYNPSHLYLRSAEKLTNTDSLHLVNGSIVDPYDSLILQRDFPDAWQKARHAFINGGFASQLIREKTSEVFSLGPRLWVFLSLILRIIGSGLFAAIPTVLASLELSLQLGLITAGLVMLVSFLSIPQARGQYPAHTAKTITTWTADSMGVSRSVTPALFRFQKGSAYFAAITSSGLLAGGGPTITIRDTLEWAGRKLSGFVLPAVTGSITPSEIADDQAWLIAKLTAQPIGVKTKSFITTPLIEDGWFLSSENRIWASIGKLRAGLQAKLTGWKSDWQATAGPFAAFGLTERLEVLLQAPVHSQPRSLTFECTYSF